MLQFGTPGWLMAINLIAGPAIATHAGSLSPAV